MGARRLTEDDEAFVEALWGVTIDNDEVVDALETDLMRDCGALLLADTRGGEGRLFRTGIPDSKVLLSGMFEVLIFSFEGYMIHGEYRADC